MGQEHRCVVLATIALLSGCREPADVSLRHVSEHSQAAEASRSHFAWKRIAGSELVAQFGKYRKDVESNPELQDIGRFENREMPEQDIAQLGVRIVHTPELQELIDAGGWIAIDVRKDKDLKTKGVIPKTIHHEYRHEGHSYTGKTQLTKNLCRELLQRHDGLVFLCNGPKCPRSFNACVAAVQYWGVSGSRIRWYREGVPGWNRTTLVPSLPVNGR